MKKPGFCKRGHIRTPENSVGGTGGCKECHALRARNRRTHCRLGHLRTPDNLYSNGTCKLCAISRASRWNKNNLDGRLQILRKYLLKTRYKLTEKSYQAILDKQNNVCPICKEPPVLGKLFVVDHDHACCPGTETCGLCIRGLIHQRCNAALGVFKDSPEICRAAAEYIENPPTKTVLSSNE